MRNSSADSGDFLVVTRAAQVTARGSGRRNEPIQTGRGATLRTETERIVKLDSTRAAVHDGKPSLRVNASYHHEVPDSNSQAELSARTNEANGETLQSFSEQSHLLAGVFRS